MNLKLKEKIRESLSAVLPITGIVLMISIFLIPMELGTIVMFLTGAIMLIVGMGFFQLGAEMSMTPIGEGVGVQISKLKKLITVLLTGLIMGIIITISEPDLQLQHWIFRLSAHYMDRFLQRILDIISRSTISGLLMVWSLKVL